MLERINLSDAELIKTCANPIHFANYIRTLADDEYMPLFSRLTNEQKIVFLHDGSILSKFMRSVQEEMRITFLYAIGYDVIQNLIKTREQLGHILKALPAKHYSDFFDRLSNEFIDHIIDHKSSLGYIMRMLNKNDHQTLVCALGDERIISLISMSDGSDDDFINMAQEDNIGFVETVYRISLKSLFSQSKQSSFYTCPNITVFASQTEINRRNNIEINNSSACTPCPYV